MAITRSSLLSLALLALALPGCSSDPVKPTPIRPAIYGTVREANGTPAADVGIGLLFTVKSAPADTTSQPFQIVAAPVPAARKVEIVYQVPTASPVRVELVRAYDSAVVATVIDGDVMTAGQYSIELPIAGRPNLVYLARVTIGGVVSERVILVNDSEVDRPVAVTRTDAAGRFRIDYSMLTRDRRFLQVFEDGRTGASLGIGDRIGIVVPRTDSTSTIWWVPIDTTRIADTTFTRQ